MGAGVSAVTLVTGLAYCRSSGVLSRLHCAKTAQSLGNFNQIPPTCRM